MIARWVRAAAGGEVDNIESQRHSAGGLPGSSHVNSRGTGGSHCKEVSEYVSLSDTILPSLWEGLRKRQRQKDITMPNE
jgi:hypothetical protein